jgi:CrcB protein
LTTALICCTISIDEDYGEGGTPMDFLAVGIGGFIGSCLRFALNKAAVLLGFSFPFGTLLSNVIAGVAIGFAMGLEISSPRVKLFITTGLLGGLSTFSAFSFETINLFGDGKYFWGVLNVALNLGLSFLGVILGMFLVKSLTKRA